MKNKKVLHLDKGLGKTLNKPKNPRTVKLINLADQAQAVVRKGEANFLIMQIHGYDSKNKALQLDAPFAFENPESRDVAFNDRAVLRNLASSVFIGQMSTIDPDLNTDNFKQTNTQ